LESWRRGQHRPGDEEPGEEGTINKEVARKKTGSFRKGVRGDPRADQDLMRTENLFF